MLFFLFTIKRKIEQLLMYPFILYGRYNIPDELLNTEFDIFFFIPGYAVGGAEIVNADILSCFPDKKIAIFFTKKSENDKMRGYFKLKNTEVHEINKWTDNKKKYWQSFIWRGIISGVINSQSRKPVVFNGQCNFAYKLSPWINSGIRQTELIHMCVYPFNLITIPYVKFFAVRVVITSTVLAQFKKLYRKLGVPHLYSERFRLINNKISLPETKPVAALNTGILKICYAGRGGYQKRVPLMVNIATHFAKPGSTVEFHFAGDFRNELPSTLPVNMKYHGILTREEMKNFIVDKDILLMTSLFEGFPLIIMEAMGNGVVPVTTAVDGVCDHLRQGYNGLLIEATDETQIINAGIQFIEQLSANRIMLQTLSQHAIDYAYNNFNAQKFKEAYRQVLLKQ
jgi:glycosyltransferase involved in cell wall biosynthesis